MDVKIEQRNTIKYKTRLGKFTVEMYAELKRVYKDQRVAHTTILQWYAPFLSRCELSALIPSSGWPKTVITEVN